MESRTSRVVISGLLPVARASEGRNREIGDCKSFYRYVKRKRLVKTNVGPLQSETD